MNKNIIMTRRRRALLMNGVWALNGVISFVGLSYSMQHNYSGLASFNLVSLIASIMYFLINDIVRTT